MHLRNDKWIGPRAETDAIIERGKIEKDEESKNEGQGSDNRTILEFESYQREVQTQ